MDHLDASTTGAPGEDARAARESEILDGAFEAALRHWADGSPFDLDAVASRHPELRFALEETVRLARDVAVRRPLVTAELPGFDVLAELGRGGMGTVYRARQRSLGRIVALKVLPPAITASPRARKRLLAEARALARVRHPHVVAVHEVVEQGDLCAYAMEWIEGASLAALLDHLRGRSAPPTVEAVTLFLGGEPRSEPAPTSFVVLVCRLALALARALGEVHRAGLLHRDVKPSNVLLRRDGTPVLSDFGLARDVSEQHETRPGDFVGTAHYAAPEQLRGESDRIDPRTDVYALGVTLYEMISLRLPIRGRSAAEILRSLEEEQTIPLRLVAPSCPRDLDTIVSTATAHDPLRRYASADALGDDLERLLRLQPIRARPAGVATRAAKFTRRHSGRILAAALGAAAVLPLVAVHVARLEGRAGRRERAAEAVREARLALLDPAHVERVFLTRELQAPPGLRVLSPDAMALAVARYDEALPVLPSTGALRRERDVVALAASLAGAVSIPDSADGPVPGCPVTSEAARGLARLHRIDRIDGAALERASLDDRRALGLLAFLAGDVDLCSRAWEPFDLAHPTDPLVDAALGELHLVLGAPAIAYPRLLRACDAFPEAGFLATRLARAALAVGDREQARRHLEGVSRLAFQDPFGGLACVRAELAEAEGRLDEARTLLEESSRLGDPRSLFVLARVHLRLGHARESLRVLERLVWRLAPVRQYRRAHAQAAERWWRSLGPLQKYEEVLRAARERSDETSFLRGMTLFGELRGRGTLESTLRYLDEARGTFEHAGEPHPEGALRSLALTRRLVREACDSGRRAGGAKLRIAAALSLALDEAATAVLGARAWRGAVELLDAAPETEIFGAAARGRRLLRIDGSMPFDHLGRSVASVATGEPGRIRAIAFGADQWRAGLAGFVGVASCVDGSPRWTVRGDANREGLLGSIVAGVGDVDGDGHEDLGVGAPVRVERRFGWDAGAQREGGAWVLSGADGRLLHGIDASGDADSHRGASISRLGDVDGDGIPEIAVGAPYADSVAQNAGVVSIQRGSDGSTLREVHGMRASEFAGKAITGPGDADADGIPDLALAVVRVGGSDVPLGAVRIHSGLDGTILREVDGGSTGSWFGWSIAAAGDLDGDRVGDLLVGSPFERDEEGASSGCVHAISVRTGATLWRVRGGAGSRLGWSVAGLGDVDGDGVPDAIAGAPGSPHRSDRGRVLVVSGRSGTVVSSFGSEGTLGFGWAVSPAGDLDGDGRDDCLVGSPHASAAGPNSGRVEAWTAAP